jgi:hypothetical protein
VRNDNPLNFPSYKKPPTPPDPVADRRTAVNQMNHDLGEIADTLKWQFEEGEAGRLVARASLLAEMLSETLTRLAECPIEADVLYQERKPV